MGQVSGPSQNRLLANLPIAVQVSTFTHLECVNLPAGKWLLKPSEVVRHVYFPVNSVVTMNYTTMDGDETETAIIGNEGMVGISLFMGDGFTNSRSVVQTAGTAWRMPGYIFKQEVNKHPELEHLLLRYGQYLITQMSQTAVCNRFHSIHQQLCRRLLMSLDRVNNNSLDLTHELLANGLGVRREGVTEAAGKLQRRGIIKYHRGSVTVLDRSQLEKACCECYSVVRNEEGRLLSPVLETPAETYFTHSSSNMTRKSYD